MELEKILEENKFKVAGAILITILALLSIAAITYPEGGVGIIPP